MLGPQARACIPSTIVRGGDVVGLRPTGKVGDEMPDRIFIETTNGISSPAYPGSTPRSFKGRTRGSTLGLCSLRSSTARVVVRYAHPARSHIEGATGYLAPPGARGRGVSSSTANDPTQGWLSAAKTPQR